MALGLALGWASCSLSLSLLLECTSLVSMTQGPSSKMVPLLFPFCDGPAKGGCLMGDWVISGLSPALGWDVEDISLCEMNPAALIIPMDTHGPFLPCWPLLLSTLSCAQG